MLQYTPVVETLDDERFRMKDVASSTYSPETQPLNSAYTPEYTLYHRRWYILLLFSFLSANQSNLWITYGAVLDTTKDMYNVSDKMVNLLAAMGPAGYIPVCFFSSWLIGEYGLRVSCIGASCLCAIGAIIRCFADSSSYWMVILAQVVNATAGPVVMTVPPALSAIWFGVHERTFATAIGSLANYSGSAIGFLLGLAIHNVHQLKYLLYLEAIFTVALMLLFIIYFPARPPKPPSVTSSLLREPMSLLASWRELVLGGIAVFRNKDGILVLMTSGIVSGVYGAWGAMLIYILGDYYSQWDTQWLGLSNIAIGIVGGLIVGKLHDRYHHFKLLMCLFFLASGGFFAVLSLATQRIIICTFPEIMALNLAVGFTINAIYPVSFEALIEVTYPVKEEVSAGLISVMNNVACLILLIVGSYYPGNYINWAMTAVCIACFGLMLITKETYKRTKIDLIGKDLTI